MVGRMSDDTPAKLSEEGRFLYSSIEHAKKSTNARAEAFKGKKFHVTSIGGAISGTYEKLRNSAEYTEDHLLLQRAIRRFLRRSLFLSNSINSSELAEELVLELTEAGYIKNDTISEAQIRELARLADKSYAAYHGMARHRVPIKTAQNWFLDLLSVQMEWVFNDPSYMFSYISFCHYHLLKKIGRDDLAQASANPDISDDTPLAYYMSIMKNLLKVDMATMRASLTIIYKAGSTSEELVKFNKRFDSFFQDDDYKQADLVVKRFGAPLRILRRTFFHDSEYDASVIYDQQSLLSIIDQNSRASYKKAEKALDRGVTKSIVFLIITKVIIGAAIEIPIDFWLYGSIALAPLLINLLSPPILIIIQRLSIGTLKQPNTAAIREYVEDMVYSKENDVAKVALYKPRKAGNRPIFNTVYTVMSLMVFGATVYLLKLLGFNPVQGIIFFIFVSTAVFFGYRLSHIMKDLELIPARHRLIGIVRDFIYTPFIFLGQWMSGKYAQFNFMSTLLDIFIELPLKNILRLTRQWANFLDEKKADLT